MNEARSSTDVLGFWIYLMSDCVLFAVLFAAYAVLHGNTFGGPGARELFHLPYALAETVILLTSSFTAGLALLAASRGSSTKTLACLIATLALGVAFLTLEIREFATLIGAQAGPGRSGFLSSYFTLVGTHGLHVALGALWMTVLIAHLLKDGLTDANRERLALLALFWHFLDIIWIFIFTIVYLVAFV